MTLVVRKFLIALFALAIVLPAAAEPAPRIYTQAELDQLLAPVALYPDPLLAQVLMAATYPLEVAEAARWSRANPGLTGDDAVRAAQDEDWDPSVKSLLAFPQVLARMDENPDWTRALGDAFLGQEPQVMDTVQQLRRRAQAAGYLQSDGQVRVLQQGPTIALVPVNPEIVYLPYYDPLVVYGTWWWPAYRPVRWAPWPRPAGIRVSVGFFFGAFDWHRRHVRVVNVNNYYYRPPLAVNRGAAVSPYHWQHDPSHRRGVAYRVPEVRQRYAAYQPRRSEEIRRVEQRHPEERHQVLSRPPEAAPAPQQQQRQTQPQQARPQPQQARPQAVRPPAAQPQPRVERREQMQERREQRQERREVRQQSRQEQRQERGHKGGKDHS